MMNKGGPFFASFSFPKTVRAMFSGMSYLYYGFSLYCAYNVIDDALYKKEQRSKWERVSNATIVRHHYKGNSVKENYELIEYAFEYEDKKYISFARNQEFNTSTRPSVISFFEKYPIGKQIPIYVNPNEPYESSLSRNVNGNFISPAMAHNIFSFITVAMIAHGFRTFNSTKIIMGMLLEPGALHWKLGDPTKYFGHALNSFFGFNRSEESYSMTFYQEELMKKEQLRI